MRCHAVTRRLRRHPSFLSEPNLQKQYTYAYDRLTALACDSWDDAAFQTLIADFPAETRADADKLLAHVADLMRRDVKATYLKQLQGRSILLAVLSGSVALALLFPSRCVILAHLTSEVILVIFATSIAIAAASAPLLAAIAQLATQ
jgi:methionine salvage enolase-phosphatase E1